MSAVWTKGALHGWLNATGSPSLDNTVAAEPGQPSAKKKHEELGLCEL